MRYRKDDYRPALQVYAEARKVMIGEIRRHRPFGQAPPCYIWAAEIFKLGPHKAAQPLGNETQS
jgi:hypothetical protein